MKKIIVITLSLLLFSCGNIKTSSTKKEEDVFYEKNKYVIIPHHNLVNKDIDIFYKKLKKKYSDFQNIVIISPNHFSFEKKAISFPKDGKYCFKNDCVYGKKFDFLIKQQNQQVFKENGDIYTLRDHGVGNHFRFINKYFPNSKVYSIVLEILLSKDENLEKLKNKLQNYNFSGKTLFIASVDFSHHTQEKIAVFHDLITYNMLNSEKYQKVEVDCPTCLYLIKDLSRNDGKKYFNIDKRTSVDNYLNINSNFENTTHIYGEFEKEKKENLEKIFFGKYLTTKFENKTLLNENYINLAFFGDTHFSRNFINKKNKLEIENYLDCFYSNKDLKRKPRYWHNRLFYSFDFVGVNLETVIGNGKNCDKKHKLVNFQTNIKYLKNFKEIGINLYNLANNHSFDCGENGYINTKKYLKENGLNYYGNLEIFKTKIRGTKIAFIGVDDISKQLDSQDKKNLFNNIKKLKEDNYLIILNIHWGAEYIEFANNRQKKLAKEFVDLGVNLIIGHHPHVIQEYEIYKGVPIFYSLGNFIFDQNFKKTLNGIGVIVSINGEGLKYNILNFKRNEKNFKIDCNSFH